MGRSNYLIHWTGKDIWTGKKNIETVREVGKTLSDSDREKYIVRLADILESGFWMTRPAESLKGGHTRSSSGSISFKYEADLTCFTEVRLTQSFEHAKKYGFLGVGVERKYVLDRWGSPVHYVRNHENEGIVGAFFDLRHRILVQRSKGTDGLEMRELVNYLGTFLKGMSTTDTDDFTFLDENEWRIVATEKKIRASKILSTGLSKPKYRIPLLPTDVKLIVFPDAETRAMALSDPVAANVIANGEAFPLMTLEECEQF